MLQGQLLWGGGHLTGCKYLDPSAETTERKHHVMLGTLVFPSAPTSPNAFHEKGLEHLRENFASESYITRCTLVIKMITCNIFCLGELTS